MPNKAMLQDATLIEIKKIYKGLSAVSLTARSGVYHAEFIGPLWLRKSAPSSLALSGLAGWKGKKFINSHTATNILDQKGKITEKLSMQIRTIPSLVDGKTTISLHYDKKGPIPWRWVVDEIRSLDDNNLLCMTIINLPLLNKFSFPFILSRAL